ncbi:hypothetical protein RvY_00748 [Ramazzottius varieornatus]|uniref:B-cell lymphoma 9 beta-catenin binding domain-containing protein n=1 Tax=Ramazzottius varieornatus TaxID=947166 RepID=A0A1D1UER5_RAMVA|nr:hypothetical protein RvY_00748 [Ramazzottius varieornatus]
MRMRETKKSQKISSPISAQLASSGANAADASPQVPAASPINRQPKTPKSSDSGAPGTPNSSANKAEWPPQVPTPNGSDKQSIMDSQVRSVKSESGFFSDMPPPTPERCSSASITMTSQPNTPGMAQQSSRRSPASAISASAQQNQITIPNSPSLIKSEDPMDKLAQMTSSLGSGNSFGSVGSQRSPAAISAPNTPGYAPSSMQSMHGAPSPAGSMHGPFPGHHPQQQHAMMAQQMPQQQQLQAPIIDKAQQIPDQPYMQQQSLVYVYTTAQANEAADMLSKGLIRKIGEYHTNQRPNARKFVNQFHQEQMQQQHLMGQPVQPPQGWDPSMLQQDPTGMMGQMEGGQPRMPMRHPQQFANGGIPGQMYGIPPNEGIPTMNGQNPNMAAAAASHAQLVRQKKLEELHSMERQLLPDNSSMSLVPDESSQLPVRPPPPYSNATGRSTGRITTTTVGRKRTHTQLQQGEFVQQTSMGSMPQMVSQEAHYTRSTQDVDSMIKTETTFMPVPSPQPIQYVGTHLDQEVTIQKQPNRNFIRAPGSVRQPGMQMHPRYGGPGGMTPQSMMAISQQQQEFAASQQASAEASRTQAIFHAQQQQMEANMRAQQFHGGTMPNGPPTTMGPQTVNNTYVNAKIAIEHVNIQNMPSGTYTDQYSGQPALISAQSEMYGAQPGQVPQSGPSHAQMMQHQAHINMLQQQQAQEQNFQIQQQQMQMAQAQQQQSSQYDSSPQIHIKPTQPNTIQYLPTARPPLKSGPRPPPNLDFLQPWTGSGLPRGQLPPPQVQQGQQQQQQLPPGYRMNPQQLQAGQMQGQFSHMNLSEGGDPNGMAGYATYGPAPTQAQQSQQQQQQQQQQQMAAQQQQQMLSNDPQYAAQFQQFQQRLYATNVAQSGQSS